MEKPFLLPSKGYIPPAASKVDDLWKKFIGGTVENKNLMLLKKNLLLFKPGGS